MIKIIANIIVFVICVLVYSYWKDNTDVNFVATLIGGFVLSNLYQSAFENFDYLRYLLKLVQIRLQSRDLRISFASLIRIKIGSEYLLVKSRRFSNLWQPVGGVYKYFDSGLRSRFGLQDDNGKFKKSDPDELRLSFPKAKIFNVIGFMKWFDSRLGREISPDREFREEVIDTGIFDREIFKAVSFEFIGRSFDIAFSEKFQVWELKAFEVFDLKLSDDQKKAIQTLLKNENKEIVALTKKEIDHDGFKEEGNDFRIGGQTKYIL